MRENPDTSLKLLQLLADEPHHPSRLTDRDIASQLELTGQEAVLHIQCCVDNGLLDAKLQKLASLDGFRGIHVGTIWGLTALGQDFVRNAEAEGFWERAKEHCRTVGIGATTSNVAQAMSWLAQQAMG